MADTNGRLYELVAAMLVKQDQTTEILREAVSVLREHTDILKTQTQRLMRIEEYLSERVPHYGQDITIETKNGPFTGLLRKAL